MNQESDPRTTRIRRPLIALLALTVVSLPLVVANRSQADKPVPEAVTSTSDNIEQDKPSAAQIARLKLREAANAAPDKLHALGLFCHNPMGWKMLVYLPPDKAWKLYAAIRPIPFSVLVQPAPQDGNFNIRPAPQGRIVQLEGSLSINDEGYWQIIMEADRPVIQGTDLATFSFYRPGDDTRATIAKYITRQIPHRSCITGSVGTRHVVRKQNDRLELLSTRYIPKSFEGEETAETLLPGYCVWIEATPQTDTQKKK